MYVLTVKYLASTFHNHSMIGLPLCQGSSPSVELVCKYSVLLPQAILAQVEAPLDPNKELERLISECKFEEAFTKALQRSDVTIVSWLCSQVYMFSTECSVHCFLGFLLRYVCSNSYEFVCHCNY